MIAREDGGGTNRIKQIFNSGPDLTLPKLL